MQEKNHRALLEKQSYTTNDIFLWGCVERKFRKAIADGTKDFLKIHFRESGILYLRPGGIKENSKKRGCVLSLVQCFASLERGIDL